MRTRSKISALAAAALFLFSSGAALASPLIKAIEAAEQQFGALAFEAEFFRERGQRLVEVELLSGNQIIEVIYNADSLQVIETDTYNNRRRVNLVTAALSQAQISLSDAARRARKAINGGQILEAALRVTANQNANGKRYVVELRKQQREFDVIVNSQDGDIVRIIRD